MNAGQYLYVGAGLLFVVAGAFILLRTPHWRARHAAEIASRVVIDGEVTKYHFESEDGEEYRAQIEYTVDGLRYQIKAEKALPKPGPLNARIRIAYKRSMPSDAIEIEQDDAYNGRFAKFMIGLGLLLGLAGWFDL